MRVKKYRAPDRATALKQVKAELGSDAMIVHEQSVRTRSGPLGLFGKPEVEITAAIEEEALAAARHERTTGGRAPTRPAARPTDSRATPETAVKAGVETGVEQDGAQGVQATISAAGRRAAGGSPPGMAATPAPTGRSADSASVDGADRLAAILAELPKNGETFSPEMASRLADLIAQSTDSRLGDLIQASGDASPLEVAPDPGSTPSSPDGALTSVQHSTNGVAVRSANGKAAAGPVMPTLPASAPDPSAADGAPNVLHEMQRTLTDLRTAVDRLTRQSVPMPAAREAPALRTIYHRLTEQEVEPGMALELMGQIAEDLGSDDRADSSTVESKLLALLRPLLPIRALPAGRGMAIASGPQVVVIVGPTGVGKTTTVAKLAAHLSFQGQKQVCLVTTDTFRIAAAAQLGTYADIMRLPLEVVYAANELPEAIGNHQDVDYVIVDTPGCGQHNEPQLKELAGFVQAALRAAPDATVLMAVAAPTKLSDMLEVQQRFGTLHVDGLVLTKLDETRAFGPLLSLIRRAGKPVFYVTTGQNVPNDIEPASSDALARLVAGAIAGPSGLSAQYTAGSRV